MKNINVYSIPIRPTNIKTMITIFPKVERLSVIPSESPVVPNAEATSKTSANSGASSVTDKIKTAQTHRRVDKLTTTIGERTEVQCREGQSNIGSFLLRNKDYFSSVYPI